MKPGKLTTIPSQDTVKTKRHNSADDCIWAGKTEALPSKDLARGDKTMDAPMMITRTVKLDMANAHRALCRAIGAPEDAEVYGMWEDVKVTWTDVLPTLPLAREQAA